MTALVDSRIPSAAVFNTIPHFDHQVKNLDVSILSVLSKIFVASGANKAFGAGILHRHQDLLDGQAIVHTISNEHVDIAEIKDISSMDPASLKGTAFFLNNEGAFQPFEFSSTTDVPNLDHAFAKELADYLIANNLEKYIAIVPNPHKVGGMGNMLEYTILDGKVNIRIPHRVTTAAGATVAGDSCEWGFNLGDVKEATICKGTGADCSKENITIDKATICEGVDDDCSKDPADNSPVHKATICKGADASCKNSATLANEATICKSAGGSCNDSAAPVNNTTICKGADPSCNTATLVHEVTICKGADASCNNVAVSLINESTICKCVEPSCNNISGIHEATICKGADPSCNNAATSGITNATICKGAGGDCNKTVEAIICKGAEDCQQGNVQVETACEWSFGAVA